MHGKYCSKLTFEADPQTSPERWDVNFNLMILGWLHASSLCYVGLGADVSNPVFPMSSSGLEHAAVLAVQTCLDRHKQPLKYLSVVLLRRRKKFTTSIQPATAYEDESIMLSGTH